MRNRFLVTVFVSFALIAAACGGSGETATDEAPDTTEAPVEETTTVPATEAPEPVEDGNGASTPVDGQAIYEANCARCHADDGSGGRGPSLQGIATEQPDTAGGIEQVINGGGGMPAFGSQLNPEEIEAVIDYVWATF